MQLSLLRESFQINYGDSSDFEMLFYYSCHLETVIKEAGDFLKLAQRHYSFFDTNSFIFYFHFHYDNESHL